MGDVSARYKLDLLENRFASIKGSNDELNQVTSGLRSENVRLSSQVKLLEKELVMMRNVLNTSSDITGVSTIRADISEPASPPTPPSRKLDRTPGTDASSSRLSQRPTRKAPSVPLKTGSPTNTSVMSVSDIEVSPVPSRKPPPPPTQRVTIRQPDLSSNDLNKSPSRRPIENRILPSPGKEFSTINFETTASTESGRQQDTTTRDTVSTGDGGTKLDFSRADPHPTQAETVPGLRELTTLIENVSRSSTATDAAVLQEIGTTKREVVQQLGEIAESVAELREGNKNIEKYAEGSHQLKPIIDQLTATKSEVVSLSTRIEELINPSSTTTEVTETKKEITKLSDRLEDFLKTYPAQPIVSELANTKNELSRLSKHVSTLTSADTSEQLLQTKNEVIRLHTRIDQLVASTPKELPSTWDLKETKNEVANLASKIKEFVENPQPIVNQLVETKKEVGRLTSKIDDLISKPHDIVSTPKPVHINEDLTKQAIDKLTGVVTSAEAPVSQEMGAAKNSLLHLSELFGQLAESSTSAQPPATAPRASPAAPIPRASPVAPSEPQEAREVILERQIEALVSQNSAQRKEAEELRRINEAAVRLEIENAELKEQIKNSQVSDQGTGGVPEQQELDELRKQVADLHRVSDVAVRLEFENLDLKEKLSNINNQIPKTETSERESTLQQEVLTQRESIKELRHLLSEPSERERLLVQERDAMSAKELLQQNEINDLRKINESVIRLEFENVDLKEQLANSTSIPLTTKPSERELQLSQKVESQNALMDELQASVDRLSQSEQLLSQKLDSLTVADASQRKEISDLRRINEAVVSLEFENVELREQLRNQTTTGDGNNINPRPSSNAEAEITTLRRMLKANTESASRLNAENASLMETVEQQDNDIKTLKKSFKKASRPPPDSTQQDEILRLTSIMDSNAEASKVDQQNLELMQEINDKLQQRVAFLELKIDQLQQASINEGVADQDISVINRFIERAITVERLLDCKEEHVTHLSEKLADLTEDNNSLRSQLVEDSSIMATKEMNDTKQTEQTKTLTPDGDNILQNRINILTAQLSDYQKIKLESNLQQQRISDLEKRIADAATASSAELQNEISALEKEILACKVREFDLQEQLRDAKPDSETISVKTLLTTINNQNTELENLQKSATESEQQLTAIQRDVASLTATIEEQEVEISKLQNSKKLLTSTELEEHETTITLRKQVLEVDNLKAENASLMESVQKLTNSEQTLQKLLLKHQEDIQSLEEAAKKTIPQSEQQLLETVTLKETIQTLQNEIRSLSDQQQQEKQQSEHHLLELVSLRETIQEQKQTIASLTKTTDTQSEEVQTLKKTIDTLQREQPAQTEQHLLETVALKEQIQEQKKTIDSFKKQQQQQPASDDVIQTLKNEINDKATAVNEATHKLEKLSNENNELSQTLANAKNQIEALQKELLPKTAIESDDQTALLKDQLQQRERDNAETEKRCETLQVSLKKHSKQVTSLEQELREHRERELELQETIVSLQTEGTGKSPTSEVSTQHLKSQITSLEKQLSASQRNVAVLREQLSAESGTTALTPPAQENALKESLERETELKRTIDLLGSSNEMRQTAQRIANLERRNEKLKDEVAQGVSREKDLISEIEVIQQREREMNSQPLRREAEPDIVSPGTTVSPWGELSEESRKGSHSPPSQQQYLLTVIHDLESKLTASLERETRLQSIAASGSSETVRELEKKLSDALQRESHLQQSVTALSSSDADAVTEKRIMTPPSLRPNDDISRLQNTIDELKHQQLQSEQRLKFETTRAASLQKQLQNKEDNQNKIAVLEQQLLKQSITCEHRETALRGMNDELMKTRQREEDLLSELSQLRLLNHNGSNTKPVIRTPGSPVESSFDNSQAALRIEELENEIRALRKQSDLQQRDSEQRNNDLDEIMRLKVALREKEGEVHKLQQEVTNKEDHSLSGQDVLLSLRQGLTDSSFDQQTVAEIHDLTGSLLQICNPQELGEESKRISPVRSRGGVESKLRVELATVKREMKELQDATSKNEIPLEMENKLLRERIKDIQKGEGENEINAKLLLATYKKELEILREREKQRDGSPAPVNTTEPSSQSVMSAVQKAATKQESMNVVVLQNKQLKTKLSELASKMELLAASEARWKASCEQLHTELCVAAKIKSSLVHDLSLSKDVKPYESGFPLTPQPIRNEDALNLLVSKKDN